MIEIIPNDLSSTNSDTREFSDTNEAHQNDDDDDDDDLDYLSDEDGTIDPDATPRLNYLLRNLYPDLNGKK